MQRGVWTLDQGCPYPPFGLSLGWFLFLFSPRTAPLPIKKSADKNFAVADPEIGNKNCATTDPEISNPKLCHR
jgi:hypothetical protein